MYEYISGQLVSLTAATAVIDCGGVGYLMEITLNTYSAIQEKQQARLWVHEIIREDAHLLYGFYTTAERDMFRLLLAVSGVGAATARMMLSSLSVAELTNAIAAQDAKQIQRVKGVGAKTAQRIVIELQDKVEASGTIAAAAPAASQNKEEALSALVMLGFPKAAADKVLQKLDNTLSVEGLIKEALGKL
ncbi:MAG: Holliday junction branch migration protein RuvA [Bacteroidales bacterium]|nr:Holliday junction branch migration protein RuvA [Candidatus Colimorpha merdihippi]